jgi:adenosine deaminase
MLTPAQLHQLPKVELHRHFEGSLRLETLVEIAREHDLDMPHTLEGLRPLVQVTDDPPEMHAFLAKFNVLRHFYRSPEIIRRLAYEIVEDAAKDNVHYMELRFSPQALSRIRGFELEDATDWVIAAVEQAQKDYDIIVKLIVTLVRHEPVKQARHVAEIAFERHNQGIVGLDLAGDEINHSSLPYCEIFLDAKKQGMGVTIHAGEWLGAEEVRTAIERLGADRIGHGVNIVMDSEVVQLVRKHNVALEICLTSNMQTGSIVRLPQHPIKDFLDMQVPVTLNTDDPTVSNITLTDEYQIALSQVGLSYRDLYRMMFTAVDTAFLSAREKEGLRQYFREHLPTVSDIPQQKLR